MIRVLVFLVLLAFVALGAAWLADHPGEVVLTWQDYRISTPLSVAVAALIGIVTALVIVWSVVRFVFKLPDLVTIASRARRRARGFAAVSRGMVAVGSGDPAAARRHAGDAERWLGREPLTLLLKAQAAQISGDRAGAEAAFNDMLDEPETRVLGLRGLFVEARRKGDLVAARAHAAKAAELAPSVGWANEAVLEFQSAERDWRGALMTLERRAALRLIDRAEARRQRAVLLTADAIDRAEKDPDAALTAVREAVKLAPDLVPAAVLAGRLLARAGKYRKAAKTLEAAWVRLPHPDIAAAYVEIRSGDSARDRLARAETLARLASDSAESRLMLARAALDAREFARAREALAPLIAERPTLRTCVLMADIEEAEHGETGAVRAWLARASRAPRDPAWLADGVISDTWSPVSPVSGRLDAFVWGTPSEQIAAQHREAQETHRADAVIGDGDERHAAEALPEIVPPAREGPSRELPATAAEARPPSRAAGPDARSEPEPVTVVEPADKSPQPAAPAPPPESGEPAAPEQAQASAAPPVPPEEKPSPAPAAPVPQYVTEAAKASARRGISETAAPAQPAENATPRRARRASPVIFPVSRPPDDPGPVTGEDEAGPVRRTIVT
ncbi:Uncharacterized membrane-anchored protein [Chelatococcus sambhunathii]|uniref:Uncharacterized membrane-anchored protein n=1 Tax=Chelatococcus sambhunathii TaxID=363953 RepID=A0ABP2A560_9HYPH|nr:heme biosynthesis HemY N-terminal domain-containing protein [Chelatococcus sambhunathii]CUA89094.1 Uncharacterized membrane-anchored protein [Chelatococcus sambhunathii]